MSTIPNKYAFGMIGLGTMGRSLLLNMADHGFAVAGHDKDTAKVDSLNEEGKEKDVKGFDEKAFKEIQTNISHSHVYIEILCVNAKFEKRHILCHV
jgi:6-phosphogluconate dehydrogenase